MRLLADSVSSIFGTVNAPPGSDFVGSNPAQGLGKLITFFIQMVFLFASIAALIYLLWGAFEWITSEGQKEKLQKAQQKMLNAVVGIILVVVAFTIFSFVMGTVMGGKFGIGGDFSINIPHL